MPAVSISRNAEAALVVQQWIRNNKPVTAELQNKLASIIGYAASVSAGLIWHSPGYLSTSAGATMIPSSTSSPRRRWNFAWHTSPYANYIIVELVMARQNNGAATDPYGACIISNEAGTQIGTAIHHGGSWGGAASDVPSTFSAGAHLLTVPTHSGGIDFINPAPDYEYTAAFWDYNYGRIQSAAVWEVSLVPTTETGWVSNSTPTGSPIYSADRSVLATMARNLHRRAGTPVFNWCSDTDSAAQSQAAGANQGVLAQSIGNFTLVATGTTSTTAPTYQALGAFVSGNAASVSVVWPTHAVDDIALLFLVSSQSNESLSLTTYGFTLIGNAFYDTGDGYYDSMAVYWSRASSAAMSSPVIPATASTLKAAQIITFRGCIQTGNPVDAVASERGTYPATISIPGVGATLTTITNSCLVVSAFGGRSSAVSSNFSGWTNVALASITERADEGVVPVATTARYWRGIGIATGVKTTAGAIGATTATIDNAVARSGAAWIIALKP